MSRQFASDQMQALRTALGDERRALLTLIRANLATSQDHQYLAVLGESPGDSSDEALASSLADLSAARLDHEIRRLRELDEALLRLDQADFGVCAVCAQAIPLSRLLANPAARRCIDCQSTHEKTYRGSEHASL